MEIEQRQVHLWLMDQTTAVSDGGLAELNQYLPWLEDKDRQRYDRFRFDRHRQQLLLAKVLVRTVLSRYFHTVKPDNWCFNTNEYGKPFVQYPKQFTREDRLYFNVSHSASGIAMAVSRFEMTGVDIERKDKSRLVEKIAPRYFSATETRTLLALPEQQQPARFYQLWTLKEAYIKACGMGLAIPLNHFSFQFLPDGEISIDFEKGRVDNPACWQFYQPLVWNDYQLALAIKNESQATAEVVKPIEVKVLKLNSLTAEPSIISGA